MATTKPLYLNDNNCLVLNAGRYKACVDLNSLVGDGVSGDYLPLTGGTVSGTITANSFIKSEGTSSQFLKADGSVDSTTYAASSALASYLPLAGGTLTGTLNQALGTSQYHYNVGDNLSANYERFRQYWNSNLYYLTLEKGGTGQNRTLFVNVNTAGLVVSDSNNLAGGIRVLSNPNASAGSIFGVVGVLNGSSTAQNGMVVAPIIQQSGTAAISVLKISPQLSSLGSGAVLLLDVGTNSSGDNTGTHTRLFSVSNLGDTYISGKTLIGSTVDSGEKLQVTGRGSFSDRVQISGESTQNGRGLGRTGSHTTIGAYDITSGVYFQTTLGSNYMYTSPAITHINLLTGSNAAAQFQVDSNTKGLLGPRMTTAQFNAIASKPAGLQAYSTDDNGMLFYDGTRTVGHRYNGTKYQMYESTGGVWTDVN